MRVDVAVMLVGCALVGRSGGQQGAQAPHGGRSPAMDLPSNDVQPWTDSDLDKIQVVSSALRVIPRDRVRGRRAAATMPAETPWRRPRQHQFVTKEERLPAPSIVRVYQSAPVAERRKSARRIIYYATLPEIVRPPGWYDTRVDYYDARPSNPQQYRYSGYDNYKNYPHPNNYNYNRGNYPNPSDNEVTRVQSNIIDVTPPRNRFSSTPKFTIIDVEPPYNYNYNPYPPYPWQRRPSSPTYNDRPEPSLEPVKLEIPTNTSSNSSDTDNSTRQMHDHPRTVPVSLQSLSKFVT